MLLPFFTKILLESFFLCDYTIFLTITHFLESNRLVRVLFSLIFFQSILKVNRTFPSFFVFSSLWKLSAVINVLTTSVYLNPTFFDLFFIFFNLCLSSLMVALLPHWKQHFLQWWRGKMKKCQHLSCLVEQEFTIYFNQSTWRV